MNRFVAGLLVLFFCVVGSPAQAVKTALVNPTELASMDAVLLDLRTAKAYQKGHLPHALSAPYGTFPWRVSRYGRPALLPFARDLASDLGKLGIDQNTRLVLIEDDLGTAALVYWTLKSLGHAPLHILDGGQKAWIGAGLSLSTKTPPKKKMASYTPAPDLSAVADADYVVNFRDNALVPMDCRSEIYWGGEKGGPAQEDFGSIEDSLNLPSDWLLDEKTGWFRPIKDYLPIYKRKMLSMLPDFYKHRALSMPNVFFGYDGKHAAICWFAAHELIGNKEARIYDGGMVDWEKLGHTIWNLQDGMGAR